MFKKNYFGRKQMKKIAIVDFGGQYTHLIARRIRELGVFSEIFLPEQFTLQSDMAGIIFSGGPQSVSKSDAYRVDLNINNLKIPLLGICYGHQLIASMQNGIIESGESKEYGFTTVQIKEKAHIFKGLSDFEQVWMSHKDFVKTVSENYLITASSQNLPVVAYRHKTKPIFGVQFHPEVTHTKNGIKIFDNFINLCNVQREWNTNFYENQIIENIKKEAKDKNLLILLSGGVDSLVAFELCIRALGKERVFAIHVDTGFMRKNESAEIINHLKEIGYKNLKLIGAENLFLENLKKAIEPEEKRKIVGKLFVDIVHNELKNLDKEKWMLVQGTIYPDTIESGATKNSAKIKTHHNRVKEIEEMIAQGRVIEPLKELYKDEVRKLGLNLGLSKKLIERQPFPGPGLVIRILCSNGKIEKNFDSEQDKIINLIDTDKFEITVLPIKSVGVQGDFRTYRHPVAIRYKNDKLFDWNELRKLSTEILNNTDTVNRVVYSFEPLDNVEITELYLTKENVKILQDIDFEARKRFEKYDKIWQMPVVELPLEKAGKRFFVMRPIESVDAMTADFFKADYQDVKRLNENLKKEYGIAGLFYDITTKPPATIEWE